MATRVQKLYDSIVSSFTESDGGALQPELQYGELNLTVPAAQLLSVCRTLHDGEQFQFTQLTDLCGVDFSTFGVSEWETETRAGGGFSRAVDAASVGRLSFGQDYELPASDTPRFASVYHLLSVTHNVRLRIRCYAENDDFPVVPSVVPIWNSADWYEREAFDLYGILYEGHNDLRRLLTDYGFTGHPFRKDFPLIGNVEMRFDPEKGRVVYEPVSIEPRVLVPRVIRSDSRYADAQAPNPDAAES